MRDSLDTVERPSDPFDAPTRFGLAHRGGSPWPLAHAGRGHRQAHRRLERLLRELGHGARGGLAALGGSEPLPQGRRNGGDVRVDAGTRRRAGRARRRSGLSLAHRRGGAGDLGRALRPLGAQTFPGRLRRRRPLPVRRSPRWRVHQWPHRERHEPTRGLRLRLRGGGLRLWDARRPHGLEGAPPPLSGLAGHFGGWRSSRRRRRSSPPSGAWAGERSPPAAS